MRRSLLSFGLAASVLASAAVQAQGARSGDWTAGMGQGLVEHIVRDASGNRFMIVCDEGVTDDASRTNLDITIRGDGPPRKSNVKVFVDRKELGFWADEDGEILIDNHAGYGNFHYMWEDMVKKGRKTLRVEFADGRKATFSLNGARQVLGTKVCDSGFTGRTTE